MVLGLIIGLFILAGTLIVYGPAILVIMVLASGIAVLINKLCRFNSESAERAKRWLLGAGVAAVGAFAFFTGFTQLLDSNKTKAAWLPELTLPASPPSTPASVVRSLNTVAPAMLDEYCRTSCQQYFQWDPAHFERSKVINIPNRNLPNYTGLQCYYSEMPMPSGYEQRVRDAEIDEQCRQLGREGCFWSVTHTTIGDNPLDCKRAVLDPDARNQ